MGDHSIRPRNGRFGMCSRSRLDFGPSVTRRRALDNQGEASPNSRLEGQGMIVTAKLRSALKRLLTLAREERAALREDLADVAEARQAAERSLAQIDCAKDGGGAESALARGRRLRAMLATLEQAEADAQEKLAAAAGLAAQLEAQMTLVEAGTAADSVMPECAPTASARRFSARGA